MLFIRRNLYKYRKCLLYFKKRNDSSMSLVGEAIHSNKTIRMYKYVHKCGFSYYHFSVPSPLNYFAISFKNNYDLGNSLFYDAVNDSLKLHLSKNNLNLLSSIMLRANVLNNSTFAFGSDLSYPFFETSKIVLQYFSNAKYFAHSLNHLKDDFINRSEMLCTLNRQLEYELFPKTKLINSNNFNSETFSQVFKKNFNLSDGCIFTLGSFDQSQMIDLIEKYIEEYGNDFSYKVPTITDNCKFDQKTVKLEAIIEKFPIPDVRTYLLAQKLPKSESSLLFLELFHDLIINETNSVFHKYIITTRHALKMSDYSRVNYNTPTPIYTIGMDSNTISDSSYFRSILIKVLLLTQNKLFGIQSCKNIFEKIFIVNPSDNFSIVEMMKRLIYLHYSGHDILKYFSIDFFNDICNQITNKPLILNENYEKLVIDNKEYKIFEASYNENNIEIVKKNKKELTDNFYKIKNICNIYKEIPKEYKINISEMDEKIYQNMISNYYFKVENVKINNNIELKFVHSQNEIISITMFLSLKCLNEREMKNINFCCLKRRALLEKNVSQICENSRNISSLIQSGIFKPGIISLGPLDTDYGIIIEISLTPNKITDISEIFRIIFTDPFENMKSDFQKALFFNYIKSRTKIPTYDEFKSCIPQCASQVDIVEYINDIMTGKRQYDHLRSIFSSKDYNIGQYTNPRNKFILPYIDVFNMVNRNIRISCASPNKYFDEIVKGLSKIYFNDISDVKRLSFSKSKELKVKSENERYSYVESFRIPDGFYPTDYLAMEIIGNILEKRYGDIKSNNESFIFKQSYNCFSIGLTSDVKEIEHYRKLRNELLNFILDKKYSEEDFKIAKLKAYYALNMNNNPYRYSKFMIHPTIDEDYYRRKIEDVRNFSGANMVKVIQMLKEDWPATLFVGP